MTPPARHAAGWPPVRRGTRRDAPRRATNCSSSATSSSAASASAPSASAGRDPRASRAARAARARSLARAPRAAPGRAQSLRRDAEPAARPASPATGVGPASRVRAPARARARRPSCPAPPPGRPTLGAAASRARRSTTPVHDPAGVGGTGLAVPEQRDGVAARLQPRGEVGAHAPHHRRRSTSACCPTCRSARPADSPARPARTAPPATAGADSRIARRNTRPRSSARSSPPSSVTTMSAVDAIALHAQAGVAPGSGRPAADADHVGRHRHQERPVRGVHRAGHHLHACVEKGRVQASPGSAPSSIDGQLHLGQRLVLAAPDPTDPAERRTEIRPERLEPLVVGVARRARCARAPAGPRPPPASGAGPSAIVGPQPCRRVEHPRLATVARRAAEDAKLAEVGRLAARPSAAPRVRHRAGAAGG